jgi:polar amino acid transport system substrate-binding protein
MALALVLAMLVAVGGCKKKAEGPTLEPKVKPPVIGTAGTLKAGVDLDYPPFGGSANGEKVGIDVDVAAAIAERLGLKLELVDVKPKDIASALNSGKVDIMLGATAITDAVLADVSSAGSYLTDGPGIFAKVAEGSQITTVTPDQLPGKRVAAQEGSVAFWALESDYGDGFTKKYGSLKEAIDALEKGEVDYVVGDSAVAAYIARDFKDVRFVGQYGDATPLGVAVKKDATELETQVRAVLDALAADGTLDTIRSKWLGDLPTLAVPPAG